MTSLEPITREEAAHLSTCCDPRGRRKQLLELIGYQPVNLHELKCRDCTHHIPGNIFLERGGSCRLIAGQEVRPGGSCLLAERQFST